MRNAESANDDRGTATPSGYAAELKWRAFRVVIMWIVLPITAMVVVYWVLDTRVSADAPVPEHIMAQVLGEASLDEGVRSNHLQLHRWLAERLEGRSYWASSRGAWFLTAPGDTMPRVCDACTPQAAASLDSYYVTWESDGEIFAVGRFNRRQTALGGHQLSVAWVRIDGKLFTVGR